MNARAETLVGDSSLVSTAGLGKHGRDVVGGERHSELLHGLLKFLLVNVTVAVLVKHLAMTQSMSTIQQLAQLPLTDRATAPTSNT